MRRPCGSARGFDDDAIAKALAMVGSSAVVKRITFYVRGRCASRRRDQKGDGKDPAFLPQTAQTTSIHPA
jgi:inosine/xanthosine triphosphate pyrophosphatase family protein